MLSLKFVFLSFFSEGVHSRQSESCFMQVSMITTCENDTHKLYILESVIYLLTMNRYSIFVTVKQEHLCDYHMNWDFYNSFCCVTSITCFQQNFVILVATLVVCKSWKTRIDLGQDSTRRRLNSLLWDWLLPRLFAAHL